MPICGAPSWSQSEALNLGDNLGLIWIPHLNANLGHPHQGASLGRPHQEANLGCPIWEPDGVVPGWIQEIGAQEWLPDGLPQIGFTQGRLILVPIWSTSSEHQSEEPHL